MHLVFASSVTGTKGSVLFTLGVVYMISEKKLMRMIITSRASKPNHLPHNSTAASDQLFMAALLNGWQTLSVSPRKKWLVWSNSLIVAKATTCLDVHLHVRVNGTAVIGHD